MVTWLSEEEIELNNYIAHGNYYGSHSNTYNSFKHKMTLFCSVIANCFKQLSYSTLPINRNCSSIAHASSPFKCFNTCTCALPIIVTEAFLF